MRDYATDGFFNRLYERKQAQTPGLLSVRAEELDNLFIEKKARLRAVLGMDILQEMICPPDWNVVHTREADGYREEQAEMQTLPGLYTPVYILTPPRYKRTFIYTHGHGKGAEEVVDEQYAAKYQHCLPVTLARAGYRVIVPELIGFNRIVARDFREEAYGGCYAVSTRLLMYDTTMTAARVNQILQLVDYVNHENAACQRAARPVVGGISGGGLVAAYAAVLCDQLAGAFISCYANTFRGSIMALYHCVDNFVPDILSVGEEPDIIALACPTPLLISAGDADDIFPVEHTRAAIDIIKGVYAKKNAAANVTTEIFNGGHQISTTALLPWLAGLAD